MSFFEIWFTNEDFPTLGPPTTAISTPFLIMSPLLLSDKKNSISLKKIEGKNQENSQILILEFK